MLPTSQRDVSPLTFLVWRSRGETGFSTRLRRRRAIGTSGVSREPRRAIRKTWPFRGLASCIRRSSLDQFGFRGRLLWKSQTASRTKTRGECSRRRVGRRLRHTGIGKGQHTPPVTNLSRNVWLAIVGLFMEIGALVVLLIPEERTSQGASVWSWYWPLANTLYFVGLIAAAIAIAWALVSLAASVSTGGNRSRSLIALGLGVLAIVVNRLVPYH